MFKFHGFRGKRNKNTGDGKSQPECPVPSLLSWQPSSLPGPFCTLQNRYLFWLCLLLWTQDQTSMFCLLGRCASSRMGEFISPSFTLEKKKWMRSKEYLKTLPSKSDVEPWWGVWNLNAGGDTWAHASRFMSLSLWATQPGRVTGWPFACGGVGGGSSAPSFLGTTCLTPALIVRGVNSDSGGNCPEHPGSGAGLLWPPHDTAGLGTAHGRGGLGEHSHAGSSFSVPARQGSLSSA